MFAKLWYFLQTYILTIKRFDLFLQGALLVTILLESNSYLLLRRDAGTGRLNAMIEGILFLQSLPPKIDYNLVNSLNYLTFCPIPFVGTRVLAAYYGFFRVIKAINWNSIPAHVLPRL